MRCLPCVAARYFSITSKFEGASARAGRARTCLSARGSMGKAAPAKRREEFNLEDTLAKFVRARHLRPKMWSHPKAPVVLMVPPELLPAKDDTLRWDALLAYTHESTGAAAAKALTKRPPPSQAFTIPVCDVEAYAKGLPDLTPAMVDLRKFLLILVGGEDLLHSVVVAQLEDAEDLPEVTRLLLLLEVACVGSGGVRGRSGGGIVRGQAGARARAAHP